MRGGICSRSLCKAEVGPCMTRLDLLGDRPGPRPVRSKHCFQGLGFQGDSLIKLC